MKYLAIAALLPLAACVAQPVPAPEPLPDSSVCGAAGLQTLVGQPRSVLAAMTFPAPMRVIGPGMAVTMDFNPDRLNVEYDRTETITRVFCG